MDADMRSLTVSSLTALAIIGFSGIAAAHCVDGHDQRMASEIIKPEESATVSTHDGQIILPAENTGDEAKPAETAQ